MCAITVIRWSETRRSPVVQINVEESDPCAEGKRVLEGRG